MKRLIGWFAGNRIAVNLFLLTVFILGILTLPAIRREIFPEVTSEMISIAIPYPGATPEEVEKAVCVRIEEEIQSVDGIKRVTSTAVEGAGTLLVELDTGADARRAMDEIKSRIDAITTFPEEAEEPVVRELLIRRQVINVAVSGQADPLSLRRVAERVRDEISALPGITQVDLENAQVYEVAVEVSEAALRRHELTLDDVVRAVRRSSLDLPGGSVKTDGGEILLRAVGQATRAADFERLPVVARPDGSRVSVGDVASVRDGFVETDQATRFDGRPAHLIRVFRVGEQSALEISEKVHAYIAGARRRMPEGVALTSWSDDARILRSRLNLLLANGGQGLVLVFIVLALFLRVRVAFWVAFGIPLAMLGALWAMPAFDLSINLLSLFSFILVLGMLVDDGIVVSENIVSHVQRGKRGLEAAVDGAREVAVPLILAVLTTMAAFLPMLLIPGRMGKFARAIPIIVVACLVFSVLESLLALPTHLSHLAPERRRAWWKPWILLQDGVNWLLQAFIARVYRPVLDRALRWRYLTLACGLSLLVLCAGLYAGGRIKFTFFPPVEGENVVALLTMPQGTPPETTAAAIRRLEETAERVRAEFPGAVTHVLATQGDQPFRTVQRLNAGSVRAVIAQSHLGEVNLSLAPAEERSISADALLKRWRELVGPVPEAVELAYTSSLMASGDPINVELSAPDPAALRAAVDRVKAKLAEYPGVFAIADSHRAGKKELAVAVTPAAEALGVTQSDLARQVRQGFFGDEVQRFQRGRDEVRVMVRYPAGERRSLGDVEEMRVRLAGGAAVPFLAVAAVEHRRGPAVIQRVDRRRTITVTADLDRALANAEEVIASLKAGFLPALSREVAGLTWSLEGEQRQQRETLAGIQRGFIFSLLVIYALLAVPSGSYLQPAVIMLSIPFGMLGAVGAHWLMGRDLTMLSLIGMMALGGVVVNDSIVLMDFIVRARREGTPLFDAVREAGPRRFRAVLLTSITTFAGLVPMVLERSLQAQFLIPMAISLAYGVLFSTAVTLVLMPSAYLIVEDIVALLRRHEPDPAGSTPP